MLKARRGKRRFALVGPFRARFSRTRRERLLRLAPFGAAAVTVLLGLLLLDLNVRNRRASAEAERYHAASETLHRAFFHLKDVEANQRGYALTADPEFLGGYAEARSSVEAEFAALLDFVITPEEQRVYDTLRALAQRRLAASEQVVRTAQSVSMDSAAALVAGGTGRRAMDDFASAVAGVTAGMEQMRLERERAHARRFTTLFWIIIGGTLLATVTGFGSSAALARHARRRTRAAQRLVTSNRRLRRQATLLQQQGRELEEHAQQLESQALELELQTRDLEETTQELVAREERFRALIEQSPEVILVLDADCRITYASPPVERVLGRAPEQLAGVDMMSLVHEDDRQAARGTLQSLLANPGTVVPQEVRCEHADGRWCMLSGHARNLLDQPAVGGIVLNIRDITTERSVEAQLRQSQKMEAVGRLAGGVAHDFNNLLTSIQGYAGFAAESVGTEHPAHRDLQEVLKAADLAGSLTRQLLAFSRKQVTQPQLLDLNDVVEDSAGLLHRLVGPTVTIATRLAIDMQPVRMDPGQIRQVIMNLAVNARDAMPDGGRLFIETRSAVIDQEEAAARDVAAGAYSLVSMTDTGEGMTREVQDRIFEPFFTTKEQGKGTGLGLSTTYGIVRHAGGFIHVYSEPGHGTTFRVYLPCASLSEAEQHAHAAVVPATRHALTGLGVLVVEDDVAVQQFARRILERSGCTVSVAGTGEEALEILDAHDAVRVVVTDVVMPGMSGAALGGIIRSQHPAVRVLYTSGYPRDEITWRGSIPPDVAFLEKPYSSNELLKKIATLLEDSPLGAA